MALDRVEHSGLEFPAHDDLAGFELHAPLAELLEKAPCDIVPNEHASRAQALRTEATREAVALKLVAACPELVICLEGVVEFAVTAEGEDLDLLVGLHGRKLAEHLDEAVWSCLQHAGEEARLDVLQVHLQHRCGRQPPLPGRDARRLQGSRPHPIADLKFVSRQGRWASSPTVHEAPPADGMAMRHRELAVSDPDGDQLAFMVFPVLQRRRQRRCELGRWQLGIIRSAQTTLALAAPASTALASNIAQEMLQVSEVLFELPQDVTERRVPRTLR